MNNRAIFIQDHAPRTSRTVTLANGGVAYPYSDLAIGRIVGQYRTLRAAMTDDASDNDLWSIINLRHPVSRAHLGTVAILGALDDDQAKLFAVKTFGLEYENVEAAYDCIKAAPIALQRVLNREAAQGNFALTQEMLDRAARQISDRPVIWDSKNEANLVSHGGNASELLHEMVRYDSERQLTDSMNSADMACLLKEIGADDIDDEHNALIIEYGKFDTFMSRLTQAMSKASDKLKISDAQPTKPFKRNNVVNVAVQYSLSDGQSMTVVFHNPDSTPSKLQARDTLTSWKFMLNKRDITAAVSPENGKNVQLPVLAKRMMLLAEKNSAAFARANKNKAQKEADLVALEAENAQSQERIAGILAENEAIQKEIDAVVVGKAEKEVLATPAQAEAERLAQVEVIESSVQEPEATLSNRFEEYDAIAKQYGYSVNSSGVIFTPKGKNTGVKIESPVGRLKISNAKELLFSGVNPTGLGKFLEAYWYAKKTKAGVVPPATAEAGLVHTSETSVRNSPQTNETIAQPAQEASQPAVEPTGGGLEVVGVNFEWVRDGHDKLKFHLIDASGREYISIWKSGSKWATEAGEVFKTKAEAQEAGIKIAELRIRTEREEAESRKTALRRQPEPASNPDLELTEIDQKDTVPKATTVSNKKSVFEALTRYGWSLDAVSGGISKTFAGLAEAGSVSNGERTLSADFDSRERYLAVTDNNAPTGGAIIPETEIDLRDYGYDAEGFAKAAKAFNEKVEVYVLERRKLVNTPKSSETQQPVSKPPMTNPDRDYLQSIIDGKDTGLEPKAITAKIRTIISTAKDGNDTDMLSLADQAAKAYAAQVKAKAAAKLAEVQ